MAQPVTPERQHRQIGYLQRLQRLNKASGEYFLHVFNQLVRQRQVSPAIRRMADLHPGVDSDAVRLVYDLMELMDGIQEARFMRDPEGLRARQGALDDINVAVNAWTHGVCLHRAREIFRLYRHLQRSAHQMSLN